jgi:predicted nuclease of restriction endonuclease-like (RecB) superfamily
MKELNTIEGLASSIHQIHTFFNNQVQKQVNVAMTLRNWVIGCYIVEYEQLGGDRAAYGDKILETLSVKLKHHGVTGTSDRNLRLYRSFYIAYPQIRQTVSAEFQLIEYQDNPIQQTVSVELETNIISRSNSQLHASKLINNLSFSHFIELMRTDSDLKRWFYEIEAIKNNWGVRELKRAINSMLFERTGLSTDKQQVIEKHNKENVLKPEDVFRNPYMLEFLGLAEKLSYNENDLEVAIIDHLHNFLLEMGRGFCFEARQKRITFDNTHYRIDLVFYHRILRCHVLIDLKLSEFSHADAGQMNVYLNYYKENETSEGDNPPIGIILCASKNETLVKYATTGLAQQVFVSKYMINLPSEKELEHIIDEEQRKLMDDK